MKELVKKSNNNSITRNNYIERITKKNDKYKVSDIYMATCFCKKFEHGIIYTASGFCGFPLIKIGDKYCSYGYNKDGTGYVDLEFSEKHILSTRSKEISSIDIRDVTEFVRKMEEKEEYKNKEYIYLTDFQRFSDFLLQFGINIERLEDITLDKAMYTMRMFHAKWKMQMINDFMKTNNQYMVMTEGLQDKIMQQVFDAIEKGTYKVDPSFFRLKQKTFIKRCMENHFRKSPLLEAGSVNYIEGSNDPSKNGTKEIPFEDIKHEFVPTVEIPENDKKQDVPGDNETGDDKIDDNNPGDDEIGE